MKGFARLIFPERMWFAISARGREKISQMHIGTASFKPHLEYLDSNKKLIISCRNEKLNHYKGQNYAKFSVVPLASEGWHHKLAKGDYFVIQNQDVPVLNENLTSSFEDLNLPSVLTNMLSDRGITKPTYIQAKGIKTILNGHHTLLASETGSGKTLAYLLPLLAQIHSLKKITDKREKLNCPLGIIVSPSRELAHQIRENAEMFAENLGLNIGVIIGGGTKRMILSPTFKEVDLLIATVGALNKLINTGIYKVSHVQHVVLDEADTLMDDSFSSMILSFLLKFRFLLSPDTRDSDRPYAQLVMASATFPSKVDELLQEFISPELLRHVRSDHLHYVCPNVPQKFYRVGYGDKAALLLRLVKRDAVNNYPVLIFSNKPATCDWISLYLNENNVQCINLSKTLHYSRRHEAFAKFQTGTVNVLSSTDMGSRGLDTTRVKHLINYDFPIYMADYVHRCGRTGRIGSPDNCHVSHFISGPLEIDLVKNIELSVRRGQPLPNVDANIKRLLNDRISKHLL